MLSEMIRSLYQQSLLLWTWTGGFIYIVFGTWAMVHALLNKHNIRACIGWIGLIWFAPLLGIIFYFLFGINRIRRRAKSRFDEHPSLDYSERRDSPSKDSPIPSTEKLPRNFSSLASLGNKITDLPLLEGNQITPLLSGDNTYEAMLETIDEAEDTITLCTYIFAGSGIGQTFADRLIKADERGVEIRVIVDDVGARHSNPSISRQLRRAGIPVKRFMDSWLPWNFRYFNLRNHRKIMVVDGRIGFTGGVNISKQYSSADTEIPHKDVHFKLEGPVVSHLQYAFIEDWYFCSDEELEGKKWFPTLDQIGGVSARGISDGPDDEVDQIRSIILGAITSAEESIRIVTPYFLPDGELLSALTTASLKDIQVDVITPGKNNSRMVQWASFDTLAELVRNDCNVYQSEPPFDHSKLMVVDDYWTFFGSANWDPRSLKLNFEFNVEAYSSALGDTLSSHIDQIIENSRRMDAEEFKQRNFLRKVRDRAFRLFSPYL